MKDLEKIARGARRWAEDLAYKETGNENHDLEGYCAIASGELFLRLKSAGYQPELHLSRDGWCCHVFVVVQDYVVDVTATQFKAFANAPVLVIHERQAQYYWFYQTSEVFDSVERLQKTQRKDGWPPEQIAHKHYYKSHRKSVHAV